MSELLIAPSTVSVDTSAVILSPTSITADKSTASILTTLPLVTAPLTSSPVIAALAVGYSFSPGNISGALPTVVPVNPIISSCVGCFII